MKITIKIGKAIEQYAPGEVFTFNDLGLQSEEYTAGVKAMSRLAKEGIIKRAGTGKYYRPNWSPFGELKPGEDEILKTYLFSNGVRIAYVTGPALYNRLGLTTQVPKTIQVASRDKRITAKIGSLRVKPVKSYVDVTDKNYQVLGLLDAIKDFREIPDRNTEMALVRLRNLLQELNRADVEELVTASLHYPPRTRALAGALLEWNGAGENLTAPLVQSLNPFTTYSLTISKSVLPVADKWKIE